jgi:hypothetical protein
MERWRVHVIISCMDCDWQTQDYKRGTRKAYEHHRRTGHTVEGEVGDSVKWSR